MTTPDVTHETKFLEPPRRIPFGLQVGVLLGGFNSQFGWFFIGFGGLFSWVIGTGTLGPLGYLTWGLPLIGVLMVAFALRRGIRGLWLLAHGEEALARLRNKSETGDAVNNQAVYRMQFQFQDRSGTFHTSTVKTHLPKKLEDETYETILFDPARPDRNTPLDFLPGHPAGNDQGRLVARGWWYLYPVFPTLSIAGHAITVYVRYFAE